MNLPKKINPSFPGSAWERGHAHWHAAFGQVLLGRGDAILIVMKNARSQSRVRMTLGQNPIQMLRRAGAAAGHDRNGHRLRHRPGHLQIVTGLGAVGVHRSQHDFAGAQLFHAAGPGHGFQPRRHAAAVDVHLPEFSGTLTRGVRCAHPAAWVDVYHRGAAAELARNLRDELRRLHRGGVDAHLLRPGLDQPGRVGQGANAAADRERHENLLRDAPHHVEHDVPAFMAGTDVEKHQFVRPVFLITARHLDRIARVAQVQEVDAFDDSATIHVQTGDDTLRQPDHVFTLDGFRWKSNNS